MRILSTKFHGMLDYLMGLLLIFSPAIFGIPNGSVPANALQVVGGIMLLASLCTNYELGVFRMLPMKVHLAADVLLGTFVMLSPWILGFASQQVMPHVLLGVLEIGAGLMTRTVPHFNAHGAHHERAHP
jgi:hypothetical protein